MKKILIVSHNMEIGGVERSLLDLLNCVDYKQVEIDLFLYRHFGEWMSAIPKQVHLLPEISQYACLSIPMIRLIRNGHFGVLLGRLIGKSRASLYDFGHKNKESTVAFEYSHRFTRRFMPSISPNIKYDLAISFLAPHYFALEKVKAKKKIAWIHTDYSAIDINPKSELPMWNGYDAIASVSDSCTKGFITKFPNLKGKIILIENVLSEHMIWDQSQQDVSSEMPNNDGFFKLLSIGRFSYSKNLDQVPDICRRVREIGCNVKWYIIGYGDDSKINKAIHDNNMEEYVIILGKKINPYPYIRACDLFVQPSRYEGKAVTVREAQILHKPVVITNYATSQSQLNNGFDGLIVPTDNEGCAAGIATVINNPYLREMLIKNTERTDYSNRSELEKIYRLVE